MAGRGRPRKASSQRALEGNRSRRPIPPDVELHGLPECPEHLSGDAASHFRFIAGELGGAGVLKRLDTPLLAILADLLATYWECSANRDIDGMCKIAAKIVAVGCRLGLPPSERASLMAGVVKEEPDEMETKYLQIRG